MRKTGVLDFCVIPIKIILKGNCVKTPVPLEAFHQISQNYKNLHIDLLNYNTFNFSIQISHVLCT